MINKQKFLGKHPDELGLKDAVHVAIVSCIAGRAISCGARVELNKDGHAEECDSGGFGVADPFVGAVARGDKFWVLMDPKDVNSVSHSWDHKIDFPTAPAEVPKNRCLLGAAEQLGVTYEQLMQACASYVRTDRKANYPGCIAQDTVYERVESGEIDVIDMWYEWSSESGHEFDNMGSECCPEYEYPDDIPFEWV